MAWRQSFITRIHSKLQPKINVFAVIWEEGSGAELLLGLKAFTHYAHQLRLQPSSDKCSQQSDFDSLLTVLVVSPSLSFGGETISQSGASRYNKPRGGVNGF